MKDYFAKLIAENETVRELSCARPTVYLNPKKADFEEISEKLELSGDDVEDAARRLERFAPFLERAFTETKATRGIIESELLSVRNMKNAVEKLFNFKLSGELFLKLDSHLPISGSVKARGGIYEVLCVAERIAMRDGGLKITDDYSVLAEKRFRDLFSRYSIAVGSTGNLGLSIGIISSALGFSVTVHMSADAREWKKKMLRQRGVKVIEYESDYSVAVENGRRQAGADQYCHFVDDENSKELFLGYAVAAKRLAAQLSSMNIEVSEQKPLYVYLPCGVGGAPGGIAFGLKIVFGNNVRCYFAEPTNAPCMTLGLASGLHNGIAVSDIGLIGKTALDGLAVGRPSGFVGKFIEPFIDGAYTLKDETAKALLCLLAEEENARLEPSALAGVYGPFAIGSKSNLEANATHIAWATGGGMVPDSELLAYFEDGKKILENYPHE